MELDKKDYMAKLWLSLIAIVMIVFPFFPDLERIIPGSLIFFLTLISWLLKDTYASRLGIFCSLFFLTIILGSTYSQISFTIAIIGYLLFINLVPSLKRTPKWLRKGKFDKEIILLCLASASIAAVFLFLWYVLFEPNLSGLIDSFIPTGVGLPLLVWGGVLFAMINAAVEEIAYRGILLEELAGGFKLNTALVIQAIAFGALHFQGFPQGWPGVGLAIIYGVMMGYIRLRSKGILGPWAGHLLTDLVIVAIVLLAT